MFTYDDGVEDVVWTYGLFFLLTAHIIRDGGELVEKEHAELADQFLRRGVDAGLGR